MTTKGPQLIVESVIDLCRQAIVFRSLLLVLNFRKVYSSISNNNSVNYLRALARGIFMVN